MSNRKDALVFEKELNGFARKYLIQGTNPSQAEVALFQSEHDRLIHLTGELLLRHRGMAIQVYGENIPLALLIKTFGLTGVEALLEQGAIEFVLWTPLVTYNLTEVAGIDPLQSGTLGTKAHCDPEESATLGLNWLNNRLTEPQKKNIVSKVRDVYKVPPATFAGQAARLGVEGYRANRFAQLGLPNSKDVQKLARPERERLCRLAGESLELSVLANFHYSSLDSYDVLTLSNNSFEAMNSAHTMKAKVEEIFKLEGVPNFSELIKSGVVGLKAIPKLRTHKNAVKFREWIESCSGTLDTTEVSREYIDAITKPGFFDTNKGKIIKSLGISFVSGAVGGILFGPTGVLAASAVGKLLEPVTGPTLDLLDGLLLDGILKGWNPRNYFDKEIRPLLRASEGKK